MLPPLCSLYVWKICSPSVLQEVYKEKKLFWHFNLLLQQLPIFSLDFFKELLFSFAEMFQYITQILYLTKFTEKQLMWLQHQGNNRITETKSNHRRVSQFEWLPISPILRRVVMEWLFKLFTYCKIRKLKTSSTCFLIGSQKNSFL